MFLRMTLGDPLSVYSSMEIKSFSNFHFNSFHLVRSFCTPDVMPSTFRQNIIYSTDSEGLKSSLSVFYREEN